MTIGVCQLLFIRNLRHPKHIFGGNVQNRWGQPQIQQGVKDISRFRSKRCMEGMKSLGLGAAYFAACLMLGSYSIEFDADARVKYLRDKFSVRKPTERRPNPEHRRRGYLLQFSMRLSTFRHISYCIRSWVLGTLPVRQSIYYALDDLRSRCYVSFLQPTYTHIHTHTYTHTVTHTHTHTHIHTHTHTLGASIPFGRSFRTSMASSLQT